ncbi:MAG: glycosyltransferase family 2 protein [Anaerolineales bacterium]|nr:glycosyltransferase family 2 protein [Anaerolineales bacterium]
MIDLSIGIVTYNGKALLAQCLESIAKASIAATYEIIVVDNASSDDTCAWLREVHPEVRLVENRENRGIAVGNNQCLQAAHGRYVLLLNNDTIVLPGALDRLVVFADAHAEAGAVGGKLINADGSFQASFYDFPNLWLEFLHATRLWALFDRHYPSRGENGEAEEVDWICSASLLVRRAAAEQVGGVDETYVMYSDETDLQFRMRQKGWKVYYLPEVETIHLGGQSASHWQRRKMIYRGKLLFFQKHYGPARTMAVRVVFALASALKVVLWGLAWLAPGLRERARNELGSNREILLLSLGVQP